MFQKLIDKFGKNNLIIIASVTLGILFFIAFLVFRNTSPQMGLLFSQLDPTDSSKVVDKLKVMGVPFDIQDGGGQVLVPIKRVAEIRMILAEDGLPSGGIVGYELFDKKDFFGTTSNVIDLNYVRALEGELARSIKCINQIQTARVHLVFPKKELFSRDRDQPSASIAIRMRGSNKLTLKQVSAIQHLVASAVPSLGAERIAIIDAQGNLLSKGQGEAQISSVQQDIKESYEQRIANMIESLLEKSVGTGKVRAEVTADLDFDKISSTSVHYDPDGKVEKSLQVNEDNNSSKEDSDRSVSIQESIKNQNKENTPQNISKNNQETIQYEVSNTTKTHVREGWRLKRLSVAVLVDGIYTVDPKTFKTDYKKRPQQELSQLTDLAKTAVGFDQKRGDSIRVVNMRFADNEEKPDTRSILQKMWESQGDKITDMLMQWVIKFLEKIGDNFFDSPVTAIVGVVFSFIYAVRPAIEKLMKPVEQDEALEALVSQIPDNEPVYDEGGYLVDASEAVASELDMDDIEVRVKGASVKKISELMTKHPLETVNILRNWLYADR